MVTVNRSLTAQAPGDLRWLRVEDPSAAAACRGAALALAARLGFPAHRGDELALAVTEAASNLHKHAREGSMLLRITRDGDRPGIELVTIDAGPGLRDTGAALRDGHSTSGTLGIGLGAIRQARRLLRPVFGAWPWHGAGGQVLARATGLRRPPAGLVRPIAGETDCGDVFGAAQTDAGVTGVLCDGLGHGPLAATAAARGGGRGPRGPGGRARRACRARAPQDEPVPAAAPSASSRWPARSIRFAGLGNIAAVILADGTRRSMLSVPGIAGHQARTIRQFEYTAPRGAAIILHSDGISTRWEPGALPGLNARDPLVIAAALLAEAGTRRDDAGVLVLKP